MKVNFKKEQMGCRLEDVPEGVWFTISDRHTEDKKQDIFIILNTPDPQDLALLCKQVYIMKGHGLYYYGRVSQIDHKDARAHYPIMIENLDARYGV